MTSRERVLAVFRKEIPDRIPVWCGASPEFLEKSRKFRGLQNDEEVYRRFRDDFRRVYSRYAGPEKFDPVKNAEKGSRLNIFGVERAGEGYGVPANTPWRMWKTIPGPRRLDRCVPYPRGRVAVRQAVRHSGRRVVSVLP